MQLYLVDNSNFEL